MTGLRGKCREMSEAAVAADPTLTLMRGWYYCPLWNREEQHWWTRSADGTISDPTAEQFPSGGFGSYREFEGVFSCLECGEDFPEAESYGGVTVCSARCFGAMVGITEGLKGVAA